MSLALGGAVQVMRVQQWAHPRLWVLCAAVARGGCGGHLHRLAGDPGVQDLTAQVAVARALEAGADPQADARALLAALDAPALSPAGLRAALGYDTRPASEQILLDAVLEAAAQDLAAALPQAEPAVLARWRAAARSAAERVAERTVGQP